MKYKKYTGFFVIIFVLFFLFFNIFNNEIRAASGSEFFESVGKSYDSLYTGLGKVDFKPYKEFSSGEMINLHNGNLFYKYTDIQLQGQGIPLNISRVYNSSWHNPVFQGLVIQDTDKSKAYWGGEEYFNNDPQQNNIAGMRLAFAEYKMGDVKFTLKGYVPIITGSFNPGIAIDPVSSAAYSAFYLLVYINNWSENSEIFGTTMMLTHPKNILTINDIYAIVPKYPESDEDADKINQLAKGTTFLDNEINLILKNGANMVFEYDEGRKEYISITGLKKYKVKKENDVYTVFTPDGLKYYLKEYRSEIYSFDGDSFTFPYALPYKIEDNEGNKIEITRETEAPYNITEVIDTLDRKITIERDNIQDGVIETIKLPDNREIEYTIDENDNITQVRNPLGLIRKYTYVKERVERDYLNFKKDYYYLKSIRTPSGGRVEYEGPIMISERKEYPEPADTSKVNYSKFSYNLNVEDDNPMQLYQKTIFTDAVGNKSIYLFENPYEKNEDVVFPWSLTSKTEGVGEYDLVSTYHWNKNRTLKDVIVRKEENGYKTSFKYDIYGNITEINKNILVSIDKANNVSINPDGKEAVDIIKKYEIIDEGNTHIVNLPQYERVENGDYDAEVWYDYDIDPNISAISGLSISLPKDEDRIGRLNRVRKKVSQFTEDRDSTISKIIIDKKIFYNQNGNPAVTIDANGSVNQVIYDHVYNIYPVEELSYPDLNGNFLTTGIIEQAVNSDSYLANNYLSSEKEYYIDKGLLKWEEDYNGNMKQYQYDDLNRVTKTTLPDGSIENYQYSNYQSDGINMKKSTYHGVGTDPADDKVIKEIYNGSGQLVEKQLKAAEGMFNSKYYKYNKLGMVRKEIDFEGNEIEYNYDSMGRQSELINPDGSNIQRGFSYQKYEINGIQYFGLVETVINEKGAKTNYYYNSDGKLMKSIGFMKNNDGSFYPYHTAIFEYDNLGKVATIINPMGKEFHYTFNERGNLLKTIYPDDTEEMVWYDDGGNVKKAVKKGGEIVNFEYDSLSRVTRTVYSRQQGADYFLNNEDDIIQYIYDENVENGKGNRTSVIDNNGSVQYQYDSFNRVSQISRRLNETGQLWVTAYQYDQYGELSAIEYPSGANVKYRYNTRGLMEEIIYDNNGSEKTVASYNYDKNGLLEGTVYGQNLIDFSYNFDSRQRLEDINVTNSSNDLLFKNTYQYDRAGNRTRTIGTYQEETGYQYDDLNRLKVVDYPGTKKTEFNYDEIGNRKELIYRHGTGEDDFYKYTYNYNLNNNQLTDYFLSKYTHYEYDYNANGSVTDKRLVRGEDILQETDYKYDLRNQLREIRIDNLQTGASKQVQFMYNSNGWRVKKDNGIRTNYYLYGKGQQVLEERDSSGNVNNLYIYGNNGRIAYIDEDGKLRYIVTDILGSSSVITDETGKEMARYKYSPFGNLINSEGKQDISYRYTGKEFDGAIGLYYYGARYYDPSIGRFITEDPVQDGWNWFVYCSNNPLIYVDPDGYSLNEIIDTWEAYFNGIFEYAFDDTYGGSSKYQDLTQITTGYDAASYLGYQGGEFLNTHDFVFDVSLSASVGVIGGTIGYSYLQGNASDYTAGYVHVGGGLTPGLLPISGSISLGFVENAPTPYSYDEDFINLGSAAGLGVDYSFWPKGASSMSVTVATNIGVNVFRYDYYILVHSDVDGQDYYDLYQMK